MSKIETPKDLAKLIKGTKCVVIKFSASWCGPCQNYQFKHNYQELKQQCEKYNFIKFIELDVDDDSEIVNSTKYYDFAIKSIPHIKFCFDGNIIKEYNGINCLDDILQNINKVVQLVMTEQAKQSEQLEQSNLINSTGSTGSEQRSSSNTSKTNSTPYH